MATTIHITYTMKIAIITKENNYYETTCIWVTEIKVMFLHALQLLLKLDLFLYYMFETQALELG